MYMLVTNDQYELPVKIFDNVRELAEYLHISPTTVYTRMHRNKWKNKPEKIVRVEVEEEKMSREDYLRWYRKTHDRSEYFRKRYQLKKQQAKGIA